MPIIRIFIVLTATVFFYHAAAAQEDTTYVIRTKHNTELHSAAAVGSSIVATVNEGMNLHVVGESKGWLEVLHEGRTAWMPEWLDHHVVTDAELFKAATRFADVSCQKGAVWRPGFEGRIYNFSAMECSLILRPDERVLPAHEQDILVEGAKTVAFKANLALSALKTKAPEWYGYVANVVDKVIGYNDDSSCREINARTNSATICIGKHAAETVPRLIGNIVREACHVYERRAGLNLSWRDSQVLCHAIERYALEAAGLSTSSVDNELYNFVIHGY